MIGRVVARVVCLLLAVAAAVAVVTAVALLVADPTRHVRWLAVLPTAAVVGVVAGLGLLGARRGVR